MSIAVDCTELPSYTALRAAGVSGVLRYLSWLYRWGGITHTYINPKIIQKAEYDGLTANGFDVALNWEYDYLDWLGGASAGTAHATEAVRQAKALGHPPGRAIYFSADFNMSRSQWDGSGHGYATAVAITVRAGGYSPGVYGPYDVLTWCRDAKVMDRFWQAGMATSWSGGRNANPWPGAHLRQRRHILIGGIDCDANDILISDYGQYTPEGGPMSNIATQTDVVTALADGSTASGLSDDGHSRPNNIAQVRADVAALAKQLAAVSAAMGALANESEADVIEAVNAVGQQESDLAAGLRADLDDTRAQLLTALSQISGQPVDGGSGAGAVSDADLAAAFEAAATALRTTTA